MQKSKIIKLIVGLANPGSQYANTRHNAGAWWVEQYCDNNNITLKSESKFQAKIASFQLNNEKTFIAIPNTYMNNSGHAVSKIASFYKILPENILIIHDELDLEASDIRLKQSGGHAGHNGLRNIIDCLGSKDFYRLRIGIGHPGDKSQVSDYVLSNPNKTDRENINNSIQRSLEWVLNAE